MFFRKYRDNLAFFSLAFDPIDVVGLFTPENWEEEMEKWLASPKKSYNPQFVYDEPAIYEALIRAKRYRKALPRIARYYEGSSDWRAILTHDLLTDQIADFDATISLLSAFTKSDVIDHDCAEKASNRLFGEVTKDEWNIAVELTYNHPATEVFRKYLIGENEQDSSKRTRLDYVMKNFFYDFKGILTEEETTILQNKVLNEDQACHIIEQSVRYLHDHSGEDSETHIRVIQDNSLDHFGIIPVFSRPFNYDLVIPFFHKVPDGEMTASSLLQVIAHEINTHLRVMISSEMLTRRISPHFYPNALARSQCKLAQEGFATLNGDACLEETDGDVFESMAIIIPDYIRKGHNFAETAKYLYDLYGLDPDMDFRPTHRIIWTILQSFYGIRDTSSHAGYCLARHQVYILGAIRTLKEIIRNDPNYYEDPLSMMRYSELPLKMIRTINHIEHDLGKKLAPDPFEIWDFANFNPSIPNTTEYCKQLLLNL